MGSKLRYPTALSVYTRPARAIEAVDSTETEITVAGTSATLQIVQQSVLKRIIEYIPAAWANEPAHGPANNTAHAASLDAIGVWRAMRIYYKNNQIKKHKKSNKNTIG